MLSTYVINLLYHNNLKELCNSVWHVQTSKTKVFFIGEAEDVQSENMMREKFRGLNQTNTLAQKLKLIPNYVTMPYN